jgi:hypothetical protein
MCRRQHDLATVDETENAAKDKKRRGACLEVSEQQEKNIGVG